MTAVLYGLAAIGFTTLLVAAYQAGQKIGVRQQLFKRKDQDVSPVALSCECRRYSYPSPLCPKHGRQAA